MFSLRQSISLSLVLGLQAIAGSQACSVMELNRQGRFIVEDSLRTTSDPNLLVAQVGEYDDAKSGTKDPVSTQDITIDIALGGRVVWGLPEAGVKINQPLSPTVPTKNYTVTEAGNGTGLLAGPDLAEGFEFEYTKADKSRLNDVFVYSNALERGYFFHNQLKEGSTRETQPEATIFDLADPKNVSAATFSYPERPQYFHGPARNHWDSIRVVELRENGADCFRSAYFCYNETAVRLVGFQRYTRNSFHLNAIAFEQDNGPFAYTVVNIASPQSGSGENGPTEVPVEYKLYKHNIATGEKTETVLTNVQDPLSRLAQLESDADAAYSASGSWAGRLSSFWIAPIVFLVFELSRGD